MRNADRTGRRRFGSAVMLWCAILLPGAASRAAVVAGDLDASFGVGGRVDTTLVGPAYPSALVVQPDGKLVISGGLTNVPSAAGFLARYDENGNLDASFGVGGIATTDVVDGWGAVVRQPDGKLVVAGASDSPDTRLAFGRYNADGTLDPSFGGTGIVIVQVGLVGAAHALVRQADGKLVAAGSASNGVDYDVTLVRVNADGTLDSSFGGTGKVITGIGGHDVGHGVVQQADGKLVVAGVSYASDNSEDSRDFLLLRYDASGSLDPSWGTGGIVLTAISPLGDEANALALLPDGRLLAAGRAQLGSNDDFALARYNSDGSLDASFGAGTGIVTTAIGIQHDIANAVALQSDGKAVIAGTGVNPGGAYVFTLARYASSGSLDPAFGGGPGFVMTSFFSWSTSGASAVALQSDGKILATGSSSGIISLARYHGAADPTPTPTPNATPTQTVRRGCGDGSTVGGEECDDGNRIDGDGCDGNCTLPRCGNGRVTTGEECDDGNTDQADGCTNDCRICGNGITTAPEQCDDGNRNDFDGCTNACTNCGDGQLRPGEQCDDGNLLAADGCNAACRYELIPGNSPRATALDKWACLLEFRVLNPNNSPRLDSRGRVSNSQICRDNDPTCDSDPTAGVCEFRLLACANNRDPQLLGCVPVGVRPGVDVRSGGIDIILPNAPRDPTNFNALRQALQSFRDPNTGESVALPIAVARTDVCTSEFPIRVPLRGVAPRLSRGVLRVITRTGSLITDPRSIFDTDIVTLICMP